MAVSPGLVSLHSAYLAVTAWTAGVCVLDAGAVVAAGLAVAVAAGVGCEDCCCGGDGVRVGDNDVSMAGSRWSGLAHALSNATEAQAAREAVMHLDRPLFVMIPPPANAL
jgi:hypothetical protein